MRPFPNSTLLSSVHTARKASNGQELFFAHVRLHGGPAPVRRFLPELIHLVWNGKINPGKVFDLTLPLEQVAEGYRAMDEPRDQDAAAPVRKRT